MTKTRLEELRDLLRSGNENNALIHELFQHIDALTAEVAALREKLAKWEDAYGKQAALRPTTKQEYYDTCDCEDCRLRRVAKLEEALSKEPT